MASCAEAKCIIADEGHQSAATATPNPDDLLTLLAVARTGHFTSAAESLGVNHTTVAGGPLRWERLSVAGLWPAPWAAGS